MRYLTYETSSDEVDLKREIEYISNFIELHRMRIKTPEDIRFEFMGDQNVLIAPALFVPLIENSFKYASFRTNKPCVDIRLSSVNGLIVFEASNFCDNKSIDSSSDHSGYGIINLKKRLDLIYPGRYQLLIEPGEILYHTKLTINTNADQMYSN
jgi:LytS/YehU family sensor histidine kinase